MQPYSMDLVIRAVEEDENVISASTTKLVLIDVKTHTAVPKKPLFGAVRRYLVTNSNNPNSFADGMMSYRLKDIDHDIPLTASYSVRCRPGSEIKASQALFDLADPPAMILERHVERWLGELSQPDIPGFVRQCLTNRAAVQQNLSQKALVETALELTVRIALDWEESLEPVTVTKPHLSAPVSDYDDEKQDFDITVELLVDEQNKLPAVLRRTTDRQLEQVVEREAIRFIHERIDLQTFCTSLNTPPVRQALAEQLNAALTPYGRRAGILRLDAHPPKFEIRLQDEHSVTCRLHEYAKDVKIHNKVQMLLEDVAKYRTEKSPPLKSWLQEKLDRYVPEILFGAGYIDVLLRFGTYEQKIKDALTDEAKRIGYRIQQLITGPDLEPLTWKESFTVEVTGSFETSLSRFYVDVQFVVTCRIPKLETVETYLNREQDVPKLIGEHVLAVARQSLHAISPQRFHTRFNFSENGEHTVEQDLTEAIQAGIRKKFGADVFRVIIKVVETELWSRLKKLQQTISPFVVEMQSVYGDEPLIFRGNFQVDSVDGDGWRRFQSSTSGVEEIRKQLEDHILSEFHTLTPDQMQYRSPRHRKQLESLLIGVAQRFVREEFGLVIRVTNVRRDPTPQEIAANRQRLREREESLRLDEALLADWATGEIAVSHDRRERLEGYLDERKRLASETGTEEDVAELDKRIDVTREQLSVKRVPTADQVQEQLLPAAADAMTLAEFATLIGVPESKLPNQLASADEDETK